MEANKKLKAIVIGGTGAVGRELVDELLKSLEYDLITIFVRRIIDRWEKLTPEQTKKLKIVKVENLDFLGETKEELAKRFEGVQYDVLFNCLGSRVGRGDEEFKKVDYTYVVQSCEVCEKMGINHYSNCSAAQTNKNSWFTYMKVKGEAEEEIQKKNVNYISIMKPGIILNRDNDDRLGESIMKYIPFMDKIAAKDIGKAMMLDDIAYQKGEKKERKVNFINNSTMLDMVKEK